MYNVKAISYTVIVELLLLFLPLPPMLALVLVLLASRNTLMRKCVISGAGGYLRPPTSTTSTSWTTGNARQGKCVTFSPQTGRARGIEWTCSRRSAWVKMASKACAA